MTTAEQNAFKLVFPKEVFDWFDIVESSADENNVYIVFEEKNLPPLAEKDKHKKAIPKGFTEITITDFPLRGRRTLLTFNRRYWQVEGQKEYLKRDIKINFPGTQLEQEFAIFLKDDGGRKCGLANFYRKVSTDPSQRI